ncbi:hypothetical protein QFZ75_001258 [Streptomyces sp. V3I8]|nr:hypothetical protein [Streptomyces sp. V3I8]
MQVAYRAGDLCGRVERLVVAARDAPVAEEAREPAGVLLARTGVQCRILGGIEHDRRDVDGRESGRTGRPSGGLSCRGPAVRRYLRVLAL